MRGAILCASVIVLLCTAAYAASVHFKPKSPIFIDNGTTLTANGSLAGLGNQNLSVILVAEGNPTGTCTNPAGETRPPGQNPAEITLTGSQSIPASAIKNGTVNISVTTQAPTSPIPGAPDCPNSQWTETITGVLFTQATITVEQPPPTVVLSETCTFSPPTENGVVPANEVSCE
jgi:hypothetical protein